MFQTLTRVVGTLQIPESWKHHCTNALDTFPEQNIPFLTDEHLAKVRQRIRF